ncbi:MAG: multidrug ABC transporter ATP-binding protein [Gammaproteobacteria bacterium]|nr:MAG: multidrug ABC transporter ATP-binding protein [Gammaproteobacteria bacterium]
MISIDNLIKKFGQHTVVDQLSFTVNPGEVLGFLGPNGAGKSTTMKMITGFLTPTSGKITLFDQDTQANGIACKQMVGYLPEGAPGYGDMTPAQFLRFIGKVRGLSGAALNHRLAEVVETLQLNKVLNQSIDTLSKGFKRRVGLAQAIIHDPDILILDEPTDGLDPNQKHEVRKLIKNLSTDKIVIVSTHILEEVSAVCTRAIIIANGRILADGTPAELEARSKYHGAIRLDFSQAPAAAEKILALDEVAAVETLADGHSIRVFPKPGQTLFAPINELIQANQWQVRELHMERGRLDEVFRNITTAHSA